MPRHPKENFCQSHRDLAARIPFVIFHTEEYRERFFPMVNLSENITAQAFMEWCVQVSVRSEKMEMCNAQELVYAVLYVSDMLET